MRLSKQLIRFVILAPLALLPATRAEELLGPGSVRFRTGNTRGFAAADVDRDGLLDLVVATSDAGGSVRVLLGDGAGSFLVGEGIPVAPDEPGSASPESIAAADLDHDGDVDLVVANRALGNVSVLVGNGEGGFEFHSTHPVLAAPIALATSDFNEDGHPDVAVVNQSSNTVSILIGTGDGGLIDGAAQQVGAAPVALTAADFDGDEHVDLAVLHFVDADPGDEDRDISILLGDGSGGFTRQSDIALGSEDEDLRQPRDVVAGDFDADGDADLAVAIDFNGIVRILDGNGQGGFAPGQKIDVDRQPVSLAATDLDDDGDLDLVAARRFSSRISILLNDAAGTFSRSCVRTPAPEVCVETTIAFPNKVVAADFDADGAPDLAAINNPGGTVSVLLGDGLGGVGRSVVLGTGARPQGVAAADLDGDGNADLAIANSADDSVTLLFGDGERGFGRVTTLPGEVGPEPVAVISEDFDDDGFVDLALANFGGENVSVLLGNGKGAFPRASTVPVWFGPLALGAADFNEDGVLDLAVVNSSFQVFPGNLLSIRLGRGDGTFRCVPASCIDELRLPDGAGAVALGDLNADDHIDLAVTNEVTGVVRVFLGNGAGEFARLVPDRTVGGGPAAVAIGRFDGDETPDLAVAQTHADTVSLYRGLGDGGFEPMGTSVPAGDRPGALVARDVNADGSSDVLVVSAGSNSTSLLLGDGEGNLVPMPDISIGESPRALATGDFDRDGRGDVAVVQRLDDSVTVLFNQLALRADANGSNRVDGFDVAAIGRSAPAVPAEAGYGRNLDVDLDGRISGDDLAIVGGRFGELNVAASPLRGTLHDTAPPGPMQVTFAAGEAAGDRLRIKVVVQDSVNPVAAASFGVTFDPHPADEDRTQVLEYLGTVPGDYLQGAVGQVVPRGDARVPGRVDFTVSRLPLGAARPGVGTQTVIELVFRARRRGTARLEFDGFLESAPVLLDGEFASVAGIQFVGAASVAVDDTGGGEPGKKIGSSPPSLVFGETMAGSTSQRILRVSNFGFAPLEIQQASICPAGSLPPCPAGAAPFRTFLSPPAIVPAFGFIEVTVEFEPTTAGTFEAELTLDSDDRNRPRTVVPLSGAAAVSRP